MNLKELKAKYEMAEKSHMNQIKNSTNEGSYQESVLVLKSLRSKMEEAARKEGTPIPVMLWPKR